MSTITAFVAKDSLGFGVMIDGALAEWVTQPVPVDLSPNAEDLDEDGEPLSAFIHDAGTYGTTALIDMTKAEDAIEAAGYRTLPGFGFDGKRNATIDGWSSDGVDGLMVDVERA